jgi:hypothetical protein
LCPTAADVCLLDLPIRAEFPALAAVQVAVLAKVLFTNDFQIACRKVNKSRNQVRRPEFPKD